MYSAVNLRFLWFRLRQVRISDFGIRIPAARGQLAGPSRLPAWGIWLAFGLSIAFLLLSRQGTWTVPQLDWDEGTRLSIASSLNHGRTLYVDAWDHHTFLDILFFQQLFRIFPTESVPLVLRIGNAIMVCLICSLVYLGVARAARALAWGLAASVVSGFLFAKEWAIPGHGEFYHSLPVALAFYLSFVGPRTRWRLVAAGTLFGAGFFTKQTAIFDLGACLLLLFLDTPSGLRSLCFLRLKKASPKPSLETASPDAETVSAIAQAGWIILGFALVALLSAAYFLAHGALGPAFYATFVDPVVYSTGRDSGETITKFSNALTDLLGYASGVSWLITGGVPLSWVCVALLGIRRAPADPVCRLAVGAGIWLAVDLLGLALIGRFYAHYLTQVVVPASLFCTAFLGFLPRLWSWPALTPILTVLWAVPAVQWGLHGRDDFSRIEWADVRRVADFVRTATRPGEPIYLYQDSALCLYHMAERFPPTKVFMDHQLLPENKDGPALLAEALASLERSRPKLIIRGGLGRSVPEIESLIQDHYTYHTNFGVHRIFVPKPRMSPPEGRPADVQTETDKTET